MKSTASSIMFICVILYFIIGVGIAINIIVEHNKVRQEEIVQQTITEIINTSTVDDNPEPQQPEPQRPYIYHDRIPDSDITVFNDHPVGSSGRREENKVTCYGSKEGDVCMVRIRILHGNYEAEWVFMLTCGIQDEPIAVLDTETNEWVITYDRKVQLL